MWDFRTSFLTTLLLSIWRLNSVLSITGANNTLNSSNMLPFPSYWLKEYLEESKSYISTVEFNGM